MANGNLICPMCVRSRSIMSNGNLICPMCARYDLSDGQWGSDVRCVYDLDQ